MKKKLLKKIITSSVLSLFILQFSFFIFEPQIIKAATVTDNVTVTLNVTSGLTISDGANATMLPSMGITTDRAVGSSSWVVTTNSSTGYTLAVKASQAPALRNGATDSFADYTEATPGTPDVWSIASGTKEFGYGAYGTDTPSGTWGSYSSCGNTGTGAPDAAARYRGFSTSDVTISSRAGVTPTTGITTNICFAAQQSAVYAASGTYTATITATATAA